MALATFRTVSNVGSRELGGDSTRSSYVAPFVFPGEQLLMRHLLSFIKVSERLIPQVKSCEIRLEVYGASDHTPVVLDIAGPL